MTATASKNSRDVSGKDIGLMFVVGTLASAAGIALGLSIDWFPASAATQLGPISDLYKFLIVLSVPIAVTVITIVLFSILKFRRRAGEEELDGPPTHGNTNLEIIWTAIPAVVVAILCIYAANVLTTIDEASASQTKVTAWAQQFAWSFEYTSPSGKKFIDPYLWIKCQPTGSQIGQGAPCTADQIAFDIKAVDVIHSLWIPSMAMKQDAVPGITTHTKVNPNRLGNYPVVCTELCGIGHGIMRSTVHVVPPAQYSIWLKSHNAS